MLPKGTTQSDRPAFAAAFLMRPILGLIKRLLISVWYIAVVGVPLAMASSDANAQGSSYRILTQAYNSSGQQLFQKFSKTPGNIVLSPYSIGTVMAMVLTGARGPTETEMQQGLQQRLSRSEIADANADVLHILQGYDNNAATPTCPSEMSYIETQCEGLKQANGYCRPPFRAEGDKCVGLPPALPSARLVVANALTLAKGSGFVTKEYAALLKDNFAAEIFSKSTLSDINEWVSQRTQGKIERIIDQLSSDATAVLLDAVYFKARWKFVFNKSVTTNDTFHLTPAHSIPAPTMHVTAYYALVTRPGYRALLLPYNIGGLGMVIALPDRIDGLSAISAKMDAQEVIQLFAALLGGKAAPVELALPKFKTSSKADLKEWFRQLGMTRAFDPSTADFSGMTGRPASAEPVFINEVIHRALIEVMEDGTEASAATAAVMAVTGAKPTGSEPSPVPFHVDHPFLFFVIDSTTGAILFQGRIVDPSQP